MVCVFCRIAAVGLTEKRRVFSKQLSGGQKRKLSVGIAFIGGSRIVFLGKIVSLAVSFKSFDYIS